MPYCCSVITHAEQGRATPDPVVLVDLAGQVKHEDEVSGVACRWKLTLSSTRLVKRALEVLTRRKSTITFYFHRLEPNNWEFDKRNLWIRVLDALLLEIPFGSLHEKTMNVHTSLWCLINFVFHNFEHVGFEAQCIDWLSSCTRVSLHCRCHKTLREEEGCNPESLRRSPGDPAADEFDTFNKVHHPKKFSSAPSTQTWP